MTTFAHLSDYLVDGTDIWATCAAPIPCGHSAKISLSATIEQFGDIRLDELKRRLRCSHCGHRPGSVTLSRDGRPANRFN